MSKSLPPFIKGMELCERFYREVVRPLVDRYFPSVKHSAAKLDYGSEVLGFDTEQSRDHHWGPKVMIINEKAFSGGDLLADMFRHYGIGPLVGTRTWGGVTPTGNTPNLVDRGSMIAPRNSFFDINGRWAVENEGVAPDIEIEMTPKDVIAGHDPQLERAVQEALRLLETQRFERKMEPPRPVRSRRPGGGG